ncbi:MAG: hypothetical protein L3J14_04930 [Flavobacteriaceae bacterium]|nr:hypothetical protein [Flavobacteriaceae bacterium]
MKKTRILLLVCSLFISSTSVWAKALEIKSNDKLKIKEFNHAKDVNFNGNIESYWDEKANVNVYLIPMKNSEDKLVAYGDKVSFELTPIIFINLESEKIIYKDVNNRKKVLTLDVAKDGRIVNSEYFKENDSNEGYALSS